MAARPLTLVLLLALPVQAYAMSMPTVAPLVVGLLCSGLVVAVLGWSLYQFRRDHQHLARLVNELEVQNQLFMQVLHNSPIGILIQSPDRTILHHNEALTHILGLSSQALIEHDRPLRGLIDDEQLREEFYHHYQEMLRQPRHLHEWEIPIRTPAGQRKWVSVSGQTLLRNDKVMGILWMVRDVTFEHKARKKLEALTRTDPLTGLLNRRAFMEAWMHHTETARRYRHPLTLALIDLDHFKQINDRWGHQVGDLALKTFAAQMRHTFRKADVIARLGGEEFAVLMPHTSARDACTALEQLRERLRVKPISGPELPDGLKIDFSAGVTEWRRGEPFDFTYHRADVLLYNAKEQGRGCCLSEAQASTSGSSLDSTG